LGSRGASRGARGVQSPLVALTPQACPAPQQGHPQPRENVPPPEAPRLAPPEAPPPEPPFSSKPPGEPVGAQGQVGICPQQRERGANPRGKMRYSRILVAGEQKKLRIFGAPACDDDMNIKTIFM